MRANKRSERLSCPFKTRLSVTRNAPLVGARVLLDGMGRGEVSVLGVVREFDDYLVIHME